MQCRGPVIGDFGGVRGPALNSREAGKISSIATIKRGVSMGDCLLTLSELEECFLQDWRNFTPNPISDYPQYVYSELVRLGVCAPDDRRFRGVCRLPRFFHPWADMESLVLSLEFTCWLMYCDDPF